MTKAIKYNYRCFALQQIPNSNGRLEHKSYHKFDVVLRNSSPESLHETTITISFLKPARIVKVVKGDLHYTSINISDNICTITLTYFQKKEIVNLDYYVANCDGGVKGIVTLKCNSHNDLKISKSKYLKIKESRSWPVKLFQYVKKSLRFIWEKMGWRLLVSVCMLIIGPILYNKCGIGKSQNSPLSSPIDTVKPGKKPLINDTLNQGPNGSKRRK